MASRRMTAEQRARVFKALSDPRRVDMIDLLARDGSMCGTSLAESLGISVALMCHHGKVLTEAGILKKQRVGQLRVCTIDLESIREATGGWIGENAHDVDGAEDVKRSRAAAPAQKQSRPPRARTASPSRKRSTPKTA
jgi:ArsR family transcriptional regulator, arsenate/arsenite/antimonite-responsive transcriptional repressor